MLTPPSAYGITTFKADTPNSNNGEFEMEEYKNEIAKIQATLAAIATKTPVFFNITQYQKRGLVKAHGTFHGKTNWVLTAKGKQMLAVVV
jgi:hypothetical protein